VDIDTAVLQGMTAAARAARFIQQREVSRPALGAWVDPQLCTGCAQCVETCAFGAIQMITPASSRRAEGFDRSVIDSFLCQFCGNCVVACPSKAIDLPGASDPQIFAQIDAALAARQNGAAPVLVFGCQWSGFAAMELAGARGLHYPARTRVIELPCSARLDPLHVLYAFYNGAASIVVALCPPDECHFGSGNRYAKARIENLRAELDAHGIAPQRLRIAQMMGDDARAWVRAVDEASNEISGGLIGVGLYGSKTKGGLLDHTAL
jgi:heterodisulfide reductase subunit A